MLILEKVLFLALKAFHPWEIIIKFSDAEATLYIENKMVIAAEYKENETSLKDFEAFKKIVEKRMEIEKLDIIPLSKSVENRMSCDVHCVMKILEEAEISKPKEKSWIEEFLLNLLSLDTNWIVNLHGTTFKGKLYLYNRKYVDAYFVDKISKKTLTGKEAFERLVENREQIKSTELQPLKEKPQEKFSINFIELLNILK
ncbi:hypothetical protein [Desulfurobacterium atlanticum]|uniref:Uncharacterized protein n=1 Tax=Desulfurobacterium atlanticum TaxID=240169 RepID=A0A238YWV3_9BACT|nr:hypothetical protein [Desulfurobacterium atlanticum]SNR75756.1 hypothetical protein SAMN06265340_10582 [Desulfurobacterium atlanticum]